MGGGIGVIGVMTTKPIQILHPFRNQTVLQYGYDTHGKRHRHLSVGHINLQVDEEVMVSPPVAGQQKDRSPAACRDIAIQVSHDKDELKRNVNILFYSRCRNDRVIPMEGAFIVHLCLRSHRFNGQILQIQILSDLANKALELIEASPGSMY